ncbi:hypothetical protein, partial [Micrococcus luteus]
CRILRQASTKLSHSQRNAAQSHCQHTAGMDDVGEGQALAYKMIAERENETVRIERESSFIIIAKARVWASEGWQVVITDKDGKSYPPEEFDKLLAA